MSKAFNVNQIVVRLEKLERRIENSIRGSANLSKQPETVKGEVISGTCSEDIAEFRLVKLKTPDDDPDTVEISYLTSNDDLADEDLVPGISLNASKEGGIVIVQVTGIGFVAFETANGDTKIGNKLYPSGAEGKVADENGADIGDDPVFDCMQGENADFEHIRVKFLTGGGGSSKWVKWDD